MRKSPFLITAELNEVLCTYLETAYKISNQTIVDERADLLRKNTVISQTPFIETTPRFQTTEFLKNLTLPQLPETLDDLARIGLPVGKYPLYWHQEEALRKAWDETGKVPSDLIIASGTGSGKTEIFYLTILADILREAKDWVKPNKPLPKMGEWDDDEWQHRRRFEKRPASVRALILYPMNALVNDQLRRLRKMLTMDAAIKWQKNNLKGNYIYFGRYTSQTLIPGSAGNKYKREKQEGALKRIESVWKDLDDKLKELGNWPHMEGPELLCRWDMQAAPPDILLTNYSMLEYMMVRPIESGIFQKTKEWLAESKENIFTLVLDEAHTYSGTKGSEVAYLIRRLFERIGAKPEQVRCIATSASLGTTSEEFKRVKVFASNLFDHPVDRFELIQAKTLHSDGPEPTISQVELDAFANFQNSLSEADNEGTESEAAQKLIKSLDISLKGRNHIEQLYNALEQYPLINFLRDKTARNATALNRLGVILWKDLGTQAQRELATAGLLAAGAIARSDGEQLSDKPPLLPSRMHLMYRGLPGLWACMNPNCNQVEQHADRPCGKLYEEPRLWCDCGGRVVEVLSCRVCGLLFGGGIQETGTSSGRIWPYEDNLEGGIGQYDQYTVFTFENPGIKTKGKGEWAEVHRNIYSTEIENNENPNTRKVWERPADDDSDKPSVKSACPRCGKRPQGDRNAIEPMRTTGAQAFSTLIGHAFRMEPGHFKPSPDKAPTNDIDDWFKAPETEEAVEKPESNPNYGRKALTFSDSRQNAARLAGDLTFLHYSDEFRQIILQVLKESEKDEIEATVLIDKTLAECIKRGIDPTFGEEKNFWMQWETERSAMRKQGETYLYNFLRREITDRQYGVEALGMARWVIPAVNAKGMPALAPYDQGQTAALINAILRILAQENVILPRSLDPEDWPNKLVETYYRKIIVLPGLKDGQSFEWGTPEGKKRRNRLTRYLISVLDKNKREAEELPGLMDALWKFYFQNKIARPTAGHRKGFGIPITLFSLAKLPNEIYVCRECKYISADTVNGICLRCGNDCEKVQTDQAKRLRNNYYRKLADFSANPEYPDPFPLRVYEHTAQISREVAEDRERYFQDIFIKDENVLQNGVDILSVTTTMEMGIDIGDLTVVGLHNTPPTVANYQQRAGRAGRRSDGVAEVITFSRQRSHDQYYYNRTAEIISGQVRIPSLHLENPVIARRHLNALVLQKFFAYLQVGSTGTNLFEAFGTVEAFLENDEARCRNLKEYLAGSEKQKILKAAENILASCNLDLNTIEAWIKEIPDLMLNFAKGSIRKALLLELLIDKGMLPRYAFPVDVVALWTSKPDLWNQGEEVQRDLSIALSEYAPGAEVIIDGKIYQSAGLFTPYDENPKYPPTGWYYECPKCHNIQYASKDNQPDKPTWQTCEMCKEPISLDPRSKNRILPVIQPKGFRTAWDGKEERYRGEGQEKAGFATPAQLAPGDSAENGSLNFEGRVYIHRKSGDLYVVNRGPADPNETGFIICPECGTQIDNANSQHKNPLTWKDCSGKKVQRSALLHYFNTDTVLIGTNLGNGMEAIPATPGGRAVWLSMGTALRQGAASFLQIDPEELAMGIRPWREPKSGKFLAEVFLYDTLPNGAGYAIEVAENIQPIIRRAMDIVDQCPTPCETACYRCLLDYGNQMNHGILDRHLAFDVLDFILNGKEPDLTSIQEERGLSNLEAFVRGNPYNRYEDKKRRYATLEGKDFQRRISIWPIHTMRTITEEMKLNAHKAGPHPVFVTHFDLSRRPFWVWEELKKIMNNGSDANSLGL